MEWSGPCIKHLYDAPPPLFCDLAEHKEPADTKTKRKEKKKKRLCVSLVNHLSAWLVYIVILQIMILFTGMLHAKTKKKKIE